jgi:hypothetical protein
MQNQSTENSFVDPNRFVSLSGLLRMLEFSATMVRNFSLKGILRDAAQYRLFLEQWIDV